VADVYLLDEYERVFSLSKEQRNRLRRFLHEWRDSVPREDRAANLVGELYELLYELDLRFWDIDDPIQARDAGSLLVAIG
jgi:hypothetical protein